MLGHETVITSAAAFFEAALDAGGGSDTFAVTFFHTVPFAPERLQLLPEQAVKDLDQLVPLMETVMVGLETGGMEAVRRPM